jgi:hypothetical protein
MAKNSSRHLIPKNQIILEQSEKSLSMSSEDDGMNKQQSNNSNSVSQSSSSNVFDLELKLHANSKFKKQLSNVKEEF